MEKRTNVAQLHAAIGTKHQTRLLSPRRARRALIISALIAVILVFLTLQWFGARVQLHQLNANISKEQVRLERQHQRQSQLQHRQKLLKNNDYIKSQAQTKYGYTKPGETNFRLMNHK
ncbi:hypothetical protein B808_665 [Fructilactobacillus florum 8D]|uniref:Cell division protein FtsL n=1 Tax=Fructilactobacillus florum 8D TaxID=1221538 RepID=W9EE68_9LACO|nr:septum formation initiator family protein [Fructilactobacillus florum]EKK20099.1 hypothetical protein B807_1105 [Fructilactobacillus florum 2F]ETO40393.1 hypothetical protein B808_665 [Fructilactobacillus florum 8D]